MWQEIISLVKSYPLDFASYLMLFLPVAIGVYRQKFLSVSLYYLVGYLLVKLIEETLINYYAILVIPNLHLQRLYLILDVLFISAIYFSVIRVDDVKKIIVTLVSLLIVSLLINHFTYKSLSVAYFINRLSTIILTIAYFRTILEDNKVKVVLKHPMFWVSSGFLLLSTGTFMTTLFKDHLLDEKKTSFVTYMLFSNVNQIMIIVHYIIISIGLWVSKFDRDNYIVSV